MRTARTIFAGSAVLAAFLGFSVFATGFAYVRKVEPGLPSVAAVAEWRPEQGTTVLAVDGTVIGVHASEFRDFVPLAEIPELVVNAFVAAEDSEYWRHEGVNPAAIVRAAVANLASDDGRLEGASTITQQVVKNLLLTPERTLDRKIKEALLALRVDEKIGKRRVLEIYLNQIYLGEGAYGVAAAAKTYFGKSLSELGPAEAATLAALPKAPSVVNPVKNPRRTLARRDYVLGRMLADGHLTSRDYEKAIARELRPMPSPPTTPRAEFAFLYPEEAVRRALVGAYGRERVYSDGGEVRTTIEPELQRVVHAELRAGLVREDRREGWNGVLARGIPLPVDWDRPDLTPPPGAEDWIVGVVEDAAADATVTTRAGTAVVRGDTLAWTGKGDRADALLERGDAVLLADLGNGPEVVSIPRVQGAVVVLNPVTGAIRAMDGGFSYRHSEFNRATQAKRQTGSVFKSFVYLSALERGFDAMSPVLDRPIAIQPAPGLPDWRPTSHSDSLGMIPLRKALELSRNEATVRLAYELGLETVADTARRAGLKLPDRLTYSMALGTVETSPLNVAEAYSAIANGGHRVHATFIPPDGPVNLESQSREFDPIAVAQLSSILEGVTYAGTATGAFEGFDQPISAKTGTTDDSKDAWLAAYGPRFVIVVWVGKDDSSPLSKGAAGGSTAGLIARRVLDRAADSFEFRPFLLPDGTDTVIADRATGLPDGNGDVVEIVRTGNVPTAR